MNFWHIFKRELRQLFIKDARRAFYLFGASAVYVIFFGLLYSPGVVKYVPIVVYDQDQTQLSRSLVQAFEDSERYEVIAYVTTQEEMEEYLRNKKAQAALAVPPDFSREIKQGRASQILLEANGSNIVIANAVMTSAQEIMMEFSAGIGKGLVEAIGQMPDQAMNRVAPIDFRLRVINNPTLSYLNFFVLGVAMAALQQGILLSVGGSMTRERFGELSGVHPVTVMMGKLSPYWIGGTLSYFLALLISAEVFDIPLRGSMLSLMLLGTVFSFAVAAMGSLMAAVCKDEVGFTQMSLTYTVPAFIYSGYAWPIHSMDGFSTAMSHLFPLTYIGDNVRDLMLSGHAPLLTYGIAVLGCIGLSCFMISVLIYGRRIETSQESKQAAV